MSREPCSECGANRGVQANEWGKYCHACGWSERTRGWETYERDSGRQDWEFRWAPDYRSQDIELYLKRYRVTNEQMDRFQVGQSGNDRFVVPFYKDGDLQWIYAKYIVLGKTPRHFRIGKRKGPKPYDLFVYHHPTSQTLVFVEDFISAMRLSEFVSVCVLCGTAAKKYNLREELGVPYLTQMRIWLDGDAAGYNGAQKLARQLDWDFPDLAIINTIDDPKDYSDEEIGEILECN